MQLALGDKFLVALVGGSVVALVVELFELEALEIGTSAACRWYHTTTSKPLIQCDAHQELARKPSCSQI